MNRFPSPFPDESYVCMVGLLRQVNQPRRRVMGIDWMNRAELSQAIPPAYTTWLGALLQAAIAGAPGVREVAS